MARVRPKAETNFQYYRVKHLVHYITNLTPFIKNNTVHTKYINTIIHYIGLYIRTSAVCGKRVVCGHKWKKLAVKHTIKLARVYQINKRLT